MLIKIRNITKQKGQGIVEYAALLAVIVVLAMMLQTSGIKGEVTNVFDSVAMLLRGETEKDKWARMGTDALLADSDSAAARLEADQEFLRNIGKQFIGMTEEQVKTVLAVPNYSTNDLKNKTILIGTFKEGVDSNDNLATEFYTKRSDGTPLTGDLYNWGSGNESGTVYDSSRRYLYSNYAVEKASTISTGSGVKATNFKFTNGRVSSVDIAINPADKNGGGKSGGLYVTVK